MYSHFSSVGGSSGANSREGFRDSGGWNNYDNNMYGQDGGSYDDEEQWDQDSGSDYDDFGDATYGSRSRRKEDVLGRNKGRSGRSKGRSGGRDRSMGGGMGANNASKRRTHADNIPDSEKPFSCDRKLSILTFITLATNLMVHCLTSLCSKLPDVPH